MARKAAAFGHAQSIHMRTSRGLVHLRMADRACLDGESPRGVRQALPATLCYTGFCRSRWLLVLVTLCYSVWCVRSEKIVCHKIGSPWVPMGPHGSPWFPMAPRKGPHGGWGPMSPGDLKVPPPPSRPVSNADAPFVPATATLVAATTRQRQHHQQQKQQQQQHQHTHTHTHTHQ